MHFVMDFDEEKPSVQQATRFHPERSADAVYLFAVRSIEFLAAIQSLRGGLSFAFYPLLNLFQELVECCVDFKSDFDSANEDIRLHLALPPITGIHARAGSRGHLQTCVADNTIDFGDMMSGLPLPSQCTGTSKTR